MAYSARELLRLKAGGLGKADSSGDGAGKGFGRWKEAGSALPARVEMGGPF